jgi:hypothetical protein
MVRALLVAASALSVGLVTVWGVLSAAIESRLVAGALAGLGAIAALIMLSALDRHGSGAALFLGVPVAAAMVSILLAKALVRVSRRPG